MHEFVMQVLSPCFGAGGGDSRGYVGTDVRAYKSIPKVSVCAIGPVIVQSRGVIFAAGGGDHCGW